MKLDLPKMADRRGDSRPRRIHTGKNATARGRAQGAGCVGLCHFHAARRERVNVGRLVVLASETARVVRTEVVGEDEQDVRLPVRRGKRGIECEKGGDDEKGEVHRFAGAWDVGRETFRAPRRRGVRGLD